MAWFFKFPRSWQVLAAIAAAGLVTAGLRLGGLLGTAAQLTAYSTAILAVGAIGLAIGASGTYVEQRRGNLHLARQLARQTVAGIAQVKIERFSGPGEMLRIDVHNASERAIRNVYVWADARGVTGHYAAGVPAGDIQSRRMANVPRDDDLCWQLRVIHPGQHAYFTQLVYLNPQPVAARADGDITAFAEFTDTDGAWWRCDEDGNIIRRQSGELPPNTAVGDAVEDRDALAESPRYVPRS
jgi:hypothetical protein